MIPNTTKALSVAFFLALTIVCAAIPIRAEESKSATPEKKKSGWVARRSSGEKESDAAAQETHTETDVSADTAANATDSEESTTDVDSSSSSIEPRPLETFSPDQAIAIEPFQEPDFVFHPNVQSMSWVLGDGDRIGVFSLKSGPSYEFSDPESFTMTSGYGIHFLSGPSQTDLPPRLFDFFVGARWTKALAANFGFDVNFNAGIYTDFEDSAREGWRFPGRALLYLEPSYTTRLYAGIEYLDRDNIQLLPAGGLIWTPEPDTRLELYFPRPRFRYRLSRYEKYDRWIYLGGEYKGSSWAIERVSGLKDVVTYNEYRITLGWESRYHEKSSDDEDSDESSFFEIGYIFGRDLEYRSRVGSFTPEDTIMIRWGSRF